MSLMSDMQRDLRRRQASERGRPDSRWSRLDWGAALAGFVVVLVATLAAYVFWPLSSPVNPTVEAPVVAAVSSSRAPIASVGVSSPEPVAQSATAHSSASAASSAGVSQALERWLARADRAFEQDKLTRPATDSAYLYYRQALALAPRNEAARRGLDRIAERYLALARERAGQGERAAARRLAERGLSVRPDHPGLNKALAAWSEPVVSQRAVASSSAASSEPVATVQLTRETRDRRMLNRARERYRGGDRAGAQQQLARYISAAEREGYWALPVRRQLQRWWLDGGQTGRAASLVSAELPAAERAFLHARVLTKRGEHEQALAELEAYAAQAADDEDYRALMAGLYRKTGRYAEAASHYRRLLEVFGQRSRYWLGLALALDRQSDYRAAVAAYRRAVSAPDSSESVRRFAASRLEQLGASKP